MNFIFPEKVARILARKTSALFGRFCSLRKTLLPLEERPFELMLEFSNICNARCIFCPYTSQVRPGQVMPDKVFDRAVEQYLAMGGGSVGLTPIVGEALVDPKFVTRVKQLRSHPQIDRIWVITNGIALDAHGIDSILVDSGLTSITISTPGFDKAMYERICRCNAYERFRSNVTTLVEQNSKRDNPLTISIALRPDRPLQSVMSDPDFQPILKHGPQLDFTWSFASVGGGALTRHVKNVMFIETWKYIAPRREGVVQD